MCSSNSYSGFANNGALDVTRYSLACINLRLTGSFKPACRRNVVQCQNIDSRVKRPNNQARVQTLAESTTSARRYTLTLKSFSRRHLAAFIATGVASWKTSPPPPSSWSLPLFAAATALWKLLLLPPPLQLFIIIVCRRCHHVLDSFTTTAVPAVIVIIIVCCSRHVMNSLTSSFGAVIVIQRRRCL